MARKLSFRQRLFLNFSIIFAVFTVLVLIFQFEWEKSFRRTNFEVTLNDITELTHLYISRNGIYGNGTYHLIDSLVTILPEPNIRITVINPAGKVLYDSEADAATMENHLQRHEIQEAIRAEFRSNIGESETTGNSYC